MKYVFAILVIILFVLHQDYWQWDNTQIVLGFVPYTLLYHVILSIATAIVWLLVVQFCWPKHLGVDPAIDRQDKQANPEQP